MPFNIVMDHLRRAHRSFQRRLLPIALAGTFLLLLPAGSQSAEVKPTDAPKAAAPAPPAEIPLADIAAKAAEASTLIGNLTTTAAPSAQIEDIAKSLPDLSETLNTRGAETRSILDEAAPTLETLQTLEQEWQRHQVETTAFLNTLTQQVTKLQDGLNQLAELQKIWQSTRESAVASKTPDPVLQQIDATLTAVAGAQTKLQTERSAVLDLQSRVAQEVTKCGAALAQISQFQQKAVAGIFAPDAPPIWRVELWAGALHSLPEHVRKIGGARWSDYFQYIREPRDGIALHALLFIMLSLAFSAARRKIHLWQKSDGMTSPALSVFEHPCSAALATTLVIATSPFFQVSKPVRQVLTLVALIPMLRLAQPTISREVSTAFYACCVLFAVESVRQGYGSIQVIGQAILILETVAAIVVLFWMRRHYRQIIAKRTESSRLILLKAARLLVLITLIFSLLAGVVGLLRLARLLTPGVLVGGTLALATYAYLRVVSGVIALAFRIWPLRRLRMIAHHRDHLEGKVYRLLVWVAVIGWMLRYLGYLGLLDPTWSLLQSVLGTQLERGTISISVGNILEFLLTVVAAYLLSSFARFFLEEDVYPRIDLAPGLSYAVSSLLNYIILALGFVVALGVLGVDFSKVSVLAGAFGVGIGFGLQSIVNNFVSGLILLFERPIHVGDTIEVGNLQGAVRRIGIRASVIHTSAGADIIIPNSQLVTDRVTNWTFSDRLRRVHLPVGVNYGADPKKVIQLLEQVASGHPDVLHDPAPHALFMNYGDSSINFELRVWPKQFNLAAQVKSDLAGAIYDAVNAAGLSFPVPQREIRIVANHDIAPAALAAGAPGKDGR